MFVSTRDWVYLRMLSPHFQKQILRVIVKSGTKVFDAMCMNVLCGDLSGKITFASDFRNQMPADVCVYYYSTIGVADIINNLLTKIGSVVV